MLIVSTIGGPAPIKEIGRSRETRKTLLKDLNFKVPWHRTTLSILGQVSPTQYESLSKILRALRQHIDVGLKLPGKIFDLQLPSAGDLAGLDLEIILASQAAMERVKKCVSVPGFKVDLRNLPDIYQFAAKSIPDKII